MARKRAQLTAESAEATLDAGGILDRIGTSTATVELREVPLAQLHANPFQPRQHFDDESVAELADSMRTHGFYGHLLARKHGRGYQIAYGERRLRAAKLAGLETIPIQVRDLTDREMLEIGLTENVLRENLNPVEEARGYLRLQQEMGYSVRQIAERIGKSKSYVGTLLSLLRYADVEKAVRTADIPVRTAEELAKIEDAEQRARYLKRVLEGKLNREQLIALIVRGEEPQSVRTADTSIPVATALSRAYRTLSRQHVDQVQPAEREETIRLLQQLIDRANRLLGELEKE